MFAVLGPNGCGKTTLLKLLIGAMKPTEGVVDVPAHVAFVPQLFQVSFDYSVLDMALMGRARKIGLFSRPAAKDEAAALEALNRLGMSEHAHRPFHELSGGQRQLTIFARALAAEAEVLILDEPTSALDLKNQELVLSWIKTLSSRYGLTIVMTTHHPHHALAVADEVMLMMSEEDCLCGKPSSLLDEERLQALYGVTMKRLSFEYLGSTLETLAPIFARDEGVGSRT